MVGRIPALEGTRINAEYWLAEARHPDVEHSSALLFAEQAINAWKNAAYAAHDRIAYTESEGALGEAKKLIAKMNAGDKQALLEHLMEVE